MQKMKIKDYSSSSNPFETPCSLAIVALWVGALVKTVPTNNGVPLRICRITVQDPDASMWKPKWRNPSSVCSVVWLVEDAKNCKWECKTSEKNMFFTGYTSFVVSVEGKLTATPVVGSMKSAQYPAVHREKHISFAPFTNCNRRTHTT